MKRRAHNASYDHHRGALPLLRPAGFLRTWTFLLMSLAAFTGANAFWQYLTTGRWVNLSAEAYRHDLVTPLGELFVQPLNILHHPWMILVTGLLLAAVVFVPVVVAVLYRLGYAAVFVAVVAAVGHAPVLALALAIGCVLAGRTRLRSDMPFLAALLGLLPAGLYFYFFGLAGADTAAMLPLQRWVLYGPMLVAMVAAVLAAAMVLALAGWTGYRPGVVWPVLVILLVAPVAIFLRKVGQDELQYALLVGRLAPGEAIFEEKPLRAWTRGASAEGLNRQTQWIRLREDLQGLRRDLAGRCEDFLARHPASGRAPSVLWVRAQCESLQPDERAFEGDLIRFSASYPLPASQAFWSRLLKDYPASPQAALAAWRMGELAIRRREIAEGDRLLGEAVERLRAILQTFQEAEGESPEKTFRPDPPVPSEGHYEEALSAAERLIWLIQQNDAVNDAGSAEALAAYVNVNPRGQDCYQALSVLAGAYEQTALGDNLKLAVAQATPDPYVRASMLIPLAERRPPTDAAIEANYELGRLALRTAEAPALALLENLRTPEAYFKVIVAAPPNPWQRLARRQLEWLKPTTKPKGQP